MSTNPGRPRRNFRATLVEPFKQIRLGLYVFGICLAFVGATGFMFVTAFMEQYRHVMGIFQIVDPNLRWELVTNDVFYTNAVILGTLLTSFMGVLFTVIFRMTHRIYGPLVSVERFVTHIAAGHYTKRVAIRAGDDLQRLVGKLNAMAEELEKRHGKTAPGVPELTEQDNADDDVENEYQSAG